LEGGLTFYILKTYNTFSGAGMAGSGKSNDPQKFIWGVKHDISTPRFFEKKYFLAHIHTLLLRLHHNLFIYLFIQFINQQWH